MLVCILSKPVFAEPHSTRKKAYRQPETDSLATLQRLQSLCLDTLRRQLSATLGDGQVANEADPAEPVLLHRRWVNTLLSGFFQ